MSNLDTTHLTPDERKIAARGAGCIRVQLTTSERDTLLATVAELRHALRIERDTLNQAVDARAQLQTENAELRRERSELLAALQDILTTDRCMTAAGHKAGAAIRVARAGEGRK